MLNVTPSAVKKSSDNGVKVFYKVIFISYIPNMDLKLMYVNYFILYYIIL